MQQIHAADLEYMKEVAGHMMKHVKYLERQASAAEERRVAEAAAAD